MSQFFAFQFSKFQSWKFRNLNVSETLKIITALEVSKFISFECESFKIWNFHFYDFKVSKFQGFSFAIFEIRRFHFESLTILVFWFWKFHNLKVSKSLKVSIMTNLKIYNSQICKIWSILVAAMWPSFTFFWAAIYTSTNFSRAAIWLSLWPQCGRFSVFRPQSGCSHTLCLCAEPVTSNENQRLLHVCVSVCVCVLIDIALFEIFNTFHHEDFLPDTRIWKKCQQLVRHGQYKNLVNRHKIHIWLVSDHKLPVSDL